MHCKAVDIRRSDATRRSDDYDDEIETVCGFGVSEFNNLLRSAEDQILLREGEVQR